LGKLTVSTVIRLKAKHPCSIQWKISNSLKFFAETLNIRDTLGPFQGKRFAEKKKTFGGEVGA